MEEQISNFKDRLHKQSFKNEDLNKDLAEVSNFKTSGDHSVRESDSFSDNSEK